MIQDILFFLQLAIIVGCFAVIVEYIEKRGDESDCNG